MKKIKEKIEAIFFNWYFEIYLSLVAVFSVVNFTEGVIMLVICFSKSVMFFKISFLPTKNLLKSIK